MGSGTVLLQNVKRFNTESAEKRRRKI